MATRDTELIFELGCLRFLQRNWKQFLNPNFQNITEHTFRVVWISLVLARGEKVKNTDKMLKMAFVHDIAESRTGDRNYLSRQYVKADEEKAIEDIFKNTNLKEEFIPIWKEFEKQGSLEAKIVKDADNLDVDFELQEQKFRGHNFHPKWKTIRKKAVYNKLHTKTAKALWRKLYSSNPHDWHVLGRNRFNAGDWKDE